MENKVNATGTSSTVLTDKVNELKVIARNSLRMQLISPRLTKIGELEGEVVSTNKEIDEVKHEVLVENYEISKLDTEHPDYAKTKADKEQVVKDDTTTLENLAKSIVEINKEIDEQKASIAKIENGETKVSLDALNDLVSKLVTTSSREEVKIAV